MDKEEVNTHHICLNCRRPVKVSPLQTERGYSDLMKRECLKMYVNSMGLGSIERVTDGWSVYPCFIPDGDQIVSKTYIT